MVQVYLLYFAGTGLVWSTKPKLRLDNGNFAIFFGGYTVPETRNIVPGVLPGYICLPRCTENKWCMLVVQVLWKLPSSNSFSLVQARVPILME